MSEIEKKALALVNAARAGRPYTIDEAKREYGWCFQAVCIAIGRDEAFRQEVSDEVEKLLAWPSIRSQTIIASSLARFIIAKPDPLFEVMREVEPMTPWEPQDADKLRAALAARGLKIVENK